VSKYLAYDAVPAPDNIVADARKLGPGEVLVVEADGASTLRRYWDLPFGADHDLVEPRAALRAFEDAFVPAVERHLVSDVPLGLFLSGGLDSTAVLDAMARVMPVSQIRTFAVGFDDPSFDESGPAEAVARAVGTRHRLERLSTEVMLDLAPRVPALLDEPLADPSFVPTWLLSRFARRDVTVALGGDGGDELFLGYPTFLAHRLARLARAVVPPALSRGLLALAHALVPVSPQNLSADYQLKRFLQGLAYGEWERHVVWVGGQPPDQQATLFRDGVLPPGFLANGTLSDVARVVADFPGRHPLDLAAYLYAKLYLENLVLAKVDRAAMSNSLEVRAPFLDPAVVAVACRMAPSLKLRGTTTKWLLRRHLAERMPADIVRRPKKGFGIPLSAWLRGPLLPWLRGALSPERLAPLGLFRPEAVAHLIDQHATGRREHRKVLWSLAVLAEWTHLHADRVRGV
jgi:asparagine synthase (glutamine-hydrolysing)